MKHIPLFIDTEFTGLHKNTTLISIGVVTPAEHSGSFYAETTDYHKDQVDNWLQQNVINNLTRPKHECVNGSSNWTCVGPKHIVSTLFKKWLDNLHVSTRLIYDTEVKFYFVGDVCHYDAVLIIDMFGTAFDLPDYISPAFHDINTDIAKHYGYSIAEAFDVSREGLVVELGAPSACGDNSLAQHNSLKDAYVIKQLYSHLNT